MHITEKRTKLILDYLMDKHCLEYCSGYGEPGYSDPETGVLFCNWNNVSKQVGNYLEEAGYELEYGDEWYIDYDNNKAYRTSPDSYGWESSIKFTDDGTVLTPDDSVADWIHWCSVDAPPTGRGLPSVPSWITEADLEAEGFTRYPDEETTYETGWYPGQTDDPHEVAKKVFAEIENVDCIVFRIDGVGQFDVHWQCWYRQYEHYVEE